MEIEDCRKWLSRNPSIILKLVVVVVVVFLPLSKKNIPTSCVLAKWASSFREQMSHIISIWSSVKILLQSSNKKGNICSIHKTNASPTCRNLVWASHHPSNDEGVSFSPWHYTFTWVNTHVLFLKTDLEKHRSLSNLKCHSQLCSREPVCSEFLKHTWLSGWFCWA